MEDNFLYLICAFPSLVGILMIHALYDAKKKRSVCMAIWTAALMIMIASLYCVERYTPQYINHDILVCASGILLITCLIVFSETPKAEIIFAALVIHNALSLVVLFTRTLSACFAGLLNESALNVIFIAIYIITLAAVFFFFSTRYKDVVRKCLTVCQDKVGILISFTLLNNVALILCSNLDALWILPDPMLIIRNMNILGAEVTGYLLVFHGLTKTAEKLKIEEEAKHTKELLAVSKNYYESLVNSMAKVRMYNHDLQHIVNGLSALNEQKDYQAMDVFIRTLQSESPSSLPIWSNSPEIDAVIAHCAEHCKNEKIDFHCDYSLPKQIKISSLHMCIILGNCLQNAFEACKKLGADDEKFIRAVCFSAENKVVIHVENSFDGTLCKGDDQCLLSCKKENPEFHGFGIKSVQKVAEKYHGTCTWETKENRFVMNILLAPDC